MDNNPYAAPQVGEAYLGGGPLTPHQRRALQFYWKHRGRALTLAGVLWDCRTALGRQAVLFAALAGLAGWIAGPVVGTFVGAAFAVSVMKDIKYFQSMVAIWPALQQVFNWSEIERLLQDRDSH